MLIVGQLLLIGYFCQTKELIFKLDISHIELPCQLDNFAIYKHVLL